MLWIWCYIPCRCSPVSIPAMWDSPAEGYFNVLFHGSDSQKLTICIFHCQSFRLKVKNPDHAIAPGLEVSGLVEYYTTKAEDAQDRVILVVDNDVVEVPLVALVYVL